MHLNTIHAILLTAVTSMLQCAQSAPILQQAASNVADVDSSGSSLPSSPAVLQQQDFSSRLSKKREEPINQDTAKKILDIKKHWRRERTSDAESSTHASSGIPDEPLNINPPMLGGDNSGPMQKLKKRSPTPMFRPNKNTGKDSSTERSSAASTNEQKLWELQNQRDRQVFALTLADDAELMLSRFQSQAQGRREQLRASKPEKPDQAKYDKASYKKALRRYEEKLGDYEKNSKALEKELANAEKRYKTAHTKALKEVETVYGTVTPPLLSAYFRWELTDRYPYLRDPKYRLALEDFVKVGEHYILRKGKTRTDQLELKEKITGPISSGDPEVQAAHLRAMVWQMIGKPDSVEEASYRKMVQELVFNSGLGELSSKEKQKVLDQVRFIHTDSSAQTALHTGPPKGEAFLDAQIKKLRGDIKTGRKKVTA